MTRQNIGIGSAANDGNGDTLRQAGTKINANFREIYTFLADIFNSLPSTAVGLNPVRVTLPAFESNEPMLSASTVPEVLIISKVVELNLLLIVHVLELNVNLEDVICLSCPPIPVAGPISTGKFIW